MRADNDNPIPRDHFMPKLSPWRWAWLALVIDLLLAVLVALVQLAFGL
jgi:hypothetical protein